MTSGARTETFRQRQFNGIDLSNHFSEGNGCWVGGASLIGAFARNSVRPVPQDGPLVSQLSDDLASGGAGAALTGNAPRQYRVHPLF